jgi:hypothetical protein
MDSYQTPELEHQENWMEIVGLAYWLLWAARSQASPCVYKWQKYDPYYKKRVKYRLPQTPSEVQRELTDIILTFEQTPFLPKLQKKAGAVKMGKYSSKENTTKSFTRVKKSLKAAVYQM